MVSNLFIPVKVACVWLCELVGVDYEAGFLSVTNNCVGATRSYNGGCQPSVSQSGQELVHTKDFDQSQSRTTLLSDVEHQRLY